MFHFLNALIELNGTAIWKDLSVCDVYSATIKGLCSFFLMDTSNCLSNFGEYLLSHFARDELLKLNICPRTKATYHNAAFLIDVRKSKVFYEFQLKHD